MITREQMERAKKEFSANAAANTRATDLENEAMTDIDRQVAEVARAQESYRARTRPFVNILLGIDAISLPVILVSGDGTTMIDARIRSADIAYTAALAEQMIRDEGRAALAAMKEE